MTKPKTRSKSGKVMRSREARRTTRRSVYIVAAGIGFAGKGKTAAI
jgi:hypothetical protein